MCARGAPSSWSACPNVDVTIDGGTLCPPDSVNRPFPVRIAVADLKPADDFDSRFNVLSSHSLDRKAGFRSDYKVFTRISGGYCEGTDGRIPGAVTLQGDEGDRLDGLPAHSASYDWFAPGAYDHLAGIDRAGLMWEWLRRDPGYRAWYVDATAATGGKVDAALQWGLHFRRKPEPRRPLGPDPLAC